jgi:nucleoside-diphosphate-sugar epimerase
MGKIEKLLGWTPKVNFEEGLKRAITWFSSKRTV